ncbi:hypothetical protein [uncultured Lacinutrix sp.]|uniref:hypothetical protein n=1 Tax=uncultured Lacinutrix sp. TaxID=574032 RepID=UPI0026154B01|nr:hypothetical protein [uncultured Lacinutrix sp.]
MRHFLLQIILFATIFFIIDKAFYFFIDRAPNREHDKRLEYVLEGKINKDIIIIGSSRGARSISAEKLEHETKLKTYNLSYIASNIQFQEFVLKTLLKYNKAPKKLILVIDGVPEFEPIGNLYYRIDKLLPLKKYTYIHDELINKGEKNILSKIFCIGRISISDFKLQPKKASVLEKTSLHGSQLLPVETKPNLKYNKEIIEYDSSNENQEKLEAFRKIQHLCKVNDIELYYAFPPNYYSFSNSFYNRFLKLVNDQTKIIVYDTLDNRYKEKKYFRDESHLNKLGAEIFTSEISDFINQNKE